MSFTTTKRYFRQSYLWYELNRGRDMRFHPENGRSFGSFHFDRSLGQWFELGYWDSDYFPCISEGKNIVPGDPYPSHWRFDPWTGERLGQRGRQSKGGITMLADEKSFAETQKRREAVLLFLRGRLTPELYARVECQLRCCYLVRHETDRRKSDVRT